ncbi:MAG: hypothetical protein RSA99_00145 [Oscillospiraceae bacterium]
MTAFERYISDQVEKIVPSFEKLELRGNIGDNSYSVEFFVTVDGKKMQCFEMVDDGLIKEKELDIVSKSIANNFRKSSSYESGKINEITISI